ncbi:MAG: hypothetical protein ACTHMH_04260 [Curtobacterium sp.]
MGFFAGQHVLGATAVPLVVATSVAAGSIAAAGGAFTRDAPRALVALGIVGFVATLSPGTSSQLWFPIAVALQGLVPLVFAAAGILVAQRSASTGAVRAMALLLLVSALSWIVTAFVPVLLVVFLSAQACTLLVAAALGLHPVLRRSWRHARELWSSADVR